MQTFGHNNQGTPISGTSYWTNIEILFPLFHDPILSQMN